MFIAIVPQSSSALILESSAFNVHLATHYQPLWLNLTAQTERFLKPLDLSRVSVEDRPIKFVTASLARRKSSRLPINARAN